MGPSNFLWQRDRNSFVVPGQRDKLKILPRDGLGQNRTEQKLKQENDVLKQKTMFYNRKGRSKTGKWCSKTGNLVFFWKFLIHFVPGRHRTEGFVPGHLILPLSRDKGTLRQRDTGTKGHRDKKIFLSRDKGTTGHPVPWKPYSRPKKNVV